MEMEREKQKVSGTGKIAGSAILDGLIMGVGSPNTHLVRY